MGNHLTTQDQIIHKLNEVINAVNNIGINRLASPILPIRLDPWGSDIDKAKGLPARPVEYPNYTEKSTDHSQIGG